MPNTLPETRLSPVLGSTWKVPGMLLIGGILILQFFPTFESLIREWDTNIYYSHGYLMLPLAFWLAWRRRDVLQSLSVHPSWSGLFLLLTGLGFFIIGKKADILFAQGLSLLMVLGGTIWVLMGRSALKKLAFPIGILGFMIPLPYLLLDPIGFPMKEFAAATSAGVLQAFGMPIFQDGVYLYLPDYLLVVEDVCNGLRSLISMTMVGTVLGYILLPALGDRIILSLLSIPIAIVANILRILLTAVLGYYVSDEFAQGFLHEFSGLFVFLVSLGALMGVERILSWSNQDPISPPLSA